MSKQIEASRLNSTDRRKTVIAQGINGTLLAVTHAAYIEADGREVPFVQLNVDGEAHVLRPSEKVTITGTKAPPCGI